MIFRALDGAARAPADGRRRPRRSGSSARGSTARRWRSARSPAARSCRTRGSTSRTTTTSTSCSRAWACAPRDTPVVVTPERGAAAARRRASSPSTSGSPSARRRATCSTSSSWAAVRPGSRPRCTARRRGSTRSSLDAVSTGGQAGASSRIENYVGFPNGISGEELTARGRDPGAAARRAAQRAVRGRGPPRRNTGSTWSSWPTAARCRAAA